MTNHSSGEQERHFVGLFDMEDVAESTKEFDKKTLKAKIELSGDSPHEH